jgi:hypothetical protein
MLPYRIEKKSHDDTRNIPVSGHMVPRKKTQINVLQQSVNEKTMHSACTLRCRHKWILQMLKIKLDFWFF